MRIESNRRGGIFTKSFEGRNADTTLERPRLGALMSVQSSGQITSSDVKKLEAKNRR
jgi:hypothetical protein